MNNPYPLNIKSAEALLLSVICVRATSFCFSKACLATMSANALLGVRFTIAFFLLLVVFSGRIARGIRPADVAKGCCFGVLYYLVMLCESTGLKTESTATASFLENTAIVIVPLLSALLSRCLPSKRTMLFSLFALVGVGLVSLGRSGSAGGFGFSGGGSAGGQLFLLAAACFYAVAILVTARLTGEGDTVIMGIFQVGTIGGLGLVGSGAEGSFALPQTPLQWFFILILAVACTGFGYTLQPVAQHYLPAEKVSLMCAANPLTAGLISVCILREPLTPLAAAGELVIFLVLLLSTGAFPALDTNKTSSVSQ